MKPYPTEWERHTTLRDGQRVLLRPLRPEDAALYPEFLAHVTADDLRLRFFAPLRELSPALIAKLTQFDYAEAMAFIAIAEPTGEMLGVVRLHRDYPVAGGEYAVLVRSALKGHGLGWLLMSHMIDYARAEKISPIHGQVLAENATMLTMCAHLGFLIADDPSEDSVKIVSLDLAKHPAAA
jgi:GNAT superfamily N-acetyltransferase